jgi:hypothetical protein
MWADNGKPVSAATQGALGRWMKTHPPVGADELAALMAGNENGSSAFHNQGTVTREATGVAAPATTAP